MVSSILFNQRDYVETFIKNKEKDDFVFWISNTKYRLLKPVFIQRLKKHHPTISFTKSLTLKSKLFGPYIRTNKFEIKMRCTINLSLQETNRN